MFPASSLKRLGPVGGCPSLGTAPPPARRSIPPHPRHTAVASMHVTASHARPLVVARLRPSPPPGAIEKMPSRPSHAKRREWCVRSQAAPPARLPAAFASVAAVRLVSPGRPLRRGFPGAGAGAAAARPARLARRPLRAAATAPGRPPGGGSTRSRRGRTPLQASRTGAPARQVAFYIILVISISITLLYQNYPVFFSEYLRKWRDLYVLVFCKTLINYDIY